MDKRRRQLYLASTALAAAVAGAGYLAYQYRAPTPKLIESHTASWSRRPRAMVDLMIERYGLPNALRPGAAVWHGRGPWKRIVVHGDSPDTYLEQVISYWAPPEAARGLEEFGHGLAFDPAREELSVKSGNEELNFLALNLADRVAGGKNTPEEARRIFKKTATLAASGKSDPMTEGLLFAPHRTEPVENWTRPIDY